MKLYNSVINTVPDSNCTGCFACYNACPDGSIKMKLSAQGFYRPEIASGSCSNCGICSAKCPALGGIPAAPTNRDTGEIITYAAWSNNEILHRNSSSGGIFIEISNILLDLGGIVYGVRWNSDRTVCHSMTESKLELPLFQGSKYLQSNLGLIYKDISKKLMEGRTVLFSGLPCQVAALRSFADNENLITLDLVCHGTPSLTVFHKYLDYISASRSIRSITFRNKDAGWSKFRILIEFTDGSNYSESFRKDPFLVGFLSDLYLNAACYNCPFCSMPRQGDLTLADYWGVPKEYRNDLGVSLILSNNKKGDTLIGSLKSKGSIELMQTPFETALKGNPRLTSGKLLMPESREKYLNEIQYNDFNKLEHIIGEVSCFK